MSEQPHQALRAKGLKIVLVQAVVAFALALVWGATSGLNGFFAALSGGAACAVPNAIFAWLLFRQTGAQAAKRVVKAFYVGEVVKMMLTAIGFFLAVVFFADDFLQLITTFIATQMVLWFSPLIIKER